MQGVVHRIPGLTPRQTAATVVVVAVAAAVGGAAALGQGGLATALLGLLAVLVFAAVLQVRRRLAETAAATQLLLTEVRSLTAGQARLADRVGATAAEADTAATGRQQAALAAVESARQAVERSIRASADRLVRNEWDQTREVEALLQLFRDLRPRAPMPSSGRWALNPTGLAELMFRAERAQPRVVLELGSGTSSVWLGYLLERTGGRIVCVDHQPGYAERTRSLLRAHGLDGVAEVRFAPLRPLAIAGETYQWYDTAAFDDLSGVDLLLVDGPPGSVGREARYPALHVLEGKLSAAATVILDDADRAEERHVIGRWLETVDGLAREHEILGHQAVLTYARPSG
jgi:predicted O-methyltransferase YrrM